MPAVESVFPLWHIALTATATFLMSVVALLSVDRRANIYTRKELIVVSVVAGLSVLAWRLAGNVPQLNDDPVPLFSPNDLLCPIVTYITLGMYASLRRPADAIAWERLRTILTAISFATNVILI